MKYTIEDLHKIQEINNQIEEIARNIRHDVEYEIAARQLLVPANGCFDRSFKEKWTVIKRQFEIMYKLIFAINRSTR